MSDALRRIKPEKRRHLVPRDSIVSSSALESVRSPAVLLDANVYILDVAGLLPNDVEVLLDRCLLFHSSVSLSELATGVAASDPTAIGWRHTRDHYKGLIDSIPSSRLIVPDEQIWLDAGVISGTLSRTQNFQKHQRKECLNDALIYLSAAKAGLTVLTANRNEFDLIQQLAPHGRFVSF